jgi:hypothetical protein
MDKIINNTLNFGVLFTTFGLLAELKSRKEDVTQCMVINGNIALRLVMVGTVLKIYKDNTPI